MLEFVLSFVIFPVILLGHDNVPQPTCPGSKVAKLAGLAKGLVLSSLVTEGMNQDQVWEILGEQSMIACDAGVVVFVYSYYGISVRWSYAFAVDTAGKCRPSVVEKVTYHWDRGLEWSK